MVAMRRGYHEVDDRTDSFCLVGAGTHQPVERGIAGTGSRVTPANRFSVFVGKESVDPIVVNEA